MSAATAPAPSKPEASHHALPDPGEQVPTLAWPTVGVFTIALALFAAGTWAALDHSLPRGVTVAMNAVACFAMFTVLHDASHYSISSKRWVNSLFGRLAMPFVSPAMSFPGFGFIHIEHHRHSNDDDHDPDTFASHGKWWQLPFRWAAMDISYVAYYARNLRRRPRAELIETGMLMTVTAAGIAAAIATGTIWMVAVIYLIPERISMTVLGWWFDWLPHHGLEDTQRENRYRATRNRVGMEWLFTPLLLSQNYHLVHHLHPSVPFYRYIVTWKRNEEAYLERDAAIGTVFGKQLNPDEYREWKELNSKLLRVLPVRTPKGSSATHAVFHRVPVAAVDRLTDDSVAITFGVPEDLRDGFRFEAGQHLTVRTDLGGKDVRRNYSICSPATSDTLRIALKQIPGGAFSTYAAEELKPGDTLELMTPTGRFGTPLEPLQSKHYVAIAAGSGITPILSVLATTLEIETESRFTLIYGNRTTESTMFRQELGELESRYSDRLEVRHVRSRERNHAAELSGRIDAAKLEAWMAEDLAPDSVDEWFMCGPVDLVTMARDTLVENGVDAQHIHLELFFGYTKSATTQHSYPAAAVTVRMSGSEQTAALEPGETILEAALRAGSDTPYACMGGACGTCRARVVCGSVEMDQNFALGKADLDAGYVLTCQSHPTSPEITVDYDA